MCQGVHVPWLVCGDQRAAVWVQFFFSFVCALGIEVGSPGLSEYLYPLSHPAGQPSNSLSIEVCCILKQIHTILSHLLNQLDLQLSECSLRCISFTHPNRVHYNVDTRKWCPNAINSQKILTIYSSRVIKASVLTSLCHYEQNARTSFYLEESGKILTKIFLRNKPIMRAIKSPVQQSSQKHRKYD